MVHPKNNNAIVFKSEKILPFFPLFCFVYPFCLAGTPIIFSALFSSFFPSLNWIEAPLLLELKINPINYMEYSLTCHILDLLFKNYQFESHKSQNH